jgi:hypothetical protein
MFYSGQLGQGFVRLKFRVTDEVASRILCLEAIKMGVTTVYVGS